jgi:hypothetical protein
MRAPARVASIELTDLAIALLLLLLLLLLALHAV